MPKPSLRENLLDAGFRLMWQTGYGATGVRDIVAAAGAPQGSFTNHFRSKEDFACEVLDRYFAYVGGLVPDALCDRHAPADRSAAPLSRHHHRKARRRRLVARLHDRQLQLGDFASERAPA